MEASRIYDHGHIHLYYTRQITSDNLSNSETLCFLTYCWRCQDSYSTIHPGVTKALIQLFSIACAFRIIIIIIIITLRALHLVDKDWPKNLKLVQQDP